MLSTPTIWPEAFSFPAPLGSGPPRTNARAQYLVPAVPVFSLAFFGCQVLVGVFFWLTPTFFSVTFFVVKFLVDEEDRDEPDGLRSRDAEVVGGGR